MSAFCGRSSDMDVQLNRHYKQAGSQDGQGIGTESHGGNIQKWELLFASLVTLLLPYMGVCCLKFRYYISIN